ncbi:MAG: haloacid dehalogenase type II [Gemmatimonadaceae bacterium]|nr:haloacid dehalogenase type II [Gemmatimonadaceae bacterium]
MHRRSFLATSSLAVGSLVLPSLRIPAAAGIRAVLFDAFPIFDPRPVARLASSLFPQEGPALVAAWRTRQFEYTWLRTAGHRYRDFWSTTADALKAAARSLNVDMSQAQFDQLLNTYLHLPLWPDVAPTLAALKGAGIRTGFLTNFTPTMLSSNIATNGLGGSFDYLLSTDPVRAFKPAPAAYQLGLEATGLRAAEVAFVAFAGWDAVGAKWFGYPTVWLNRLDSPSEELEATPDAVGTDLATLRTFLGLP